MPGNRCRPARPGLVLSSEGGVRFSRAGLAETEPGDDLIQQGPICSLACGSLAGPEAVCFCERGRGGSCDPVSRKGWVLPETWRRGLPACPCGACVLAGRKGDGA